MQHPPRKVVYTEKCESKADAVWRKLQLKKGSRAKKDTLIAGNIEDLKKLSKKQFSYFCRELDILRQKIGRVKIRNSGQ
jgi:hypothetical protein